MMGHLDEIRGRLNAATPEPWMARSDGAVAQVAHSTGEQKMVVTYGPTYTSDAEFIANAPTDVARLLNAVQAVEERLSQWEGRFTGRTAEDTAMRAAIYLIRKDITTALEANRGRE
jgi:hypothetical protein